MYVYPPQAEYEKLGDLGLVAQAFRNTQRTMFAPPKLTISGVFNTLKKIAECQGREVNILFPLHNY